MLPKSAYENNEYTQKIRLKPAKLDWLKNNKEKDQTAAAFLDEILNERIKPNLFTKQKGKQR